jgi:hypothetical protein
MHRSTTANNHTLPSIVGFIKALLLSSLLLITSSASTATPETELILTFDTTIPGVTNSDSFTFPAVAFPDEFDDLYDVDIGANGVYELLDQSGSIVIDVTAYGYDAGLIQIAVRNADSGRGYFEGLRFAGSNDAAKLISIDQWGGTEIQWFDMSHAFEQLI